MDGANTVALIIGWVVISIIISLLAGLIIVFSYRAITRSWRYFSLMLASDDRHGDTIKPEYKKKIMYKQRLFFLIFRSYGLELACLADGESIFNEQWYFSPSEQYVKQPVASKG